MVVAEHNVDGGFGVLYLALGRSYAAMALTSAMTLRITNPSVPFTILTDVPLDPDAIPWFGQEDRVVDVASAGERSALARKPSVYGHARHERTLFVDADTIVLGDLDLINHTLLRFDVIARPYFERGGGRYAVRPLLDTGLVIGDAVSCNTGVIGFRRGEHVREFFATWSSKIDEIGIDNDQPPFVPALYASPRVRFFPMPRRFNEGAPSALETDDIAILHYKRRGDRNTRRLVEDVGVRLFGDSEELRSAVRNALRPGRSKRRQVAYLRSRNQDLIGRSIVTPVLKRARLRGWI